VSGRVAPAGLSLLTAAAWAVSLAVLSGRPELFVAALPCALALGIAVLRRSVPSCSVVRDVSSARVHEGEPITVSVTVTAHTRLPLTEILDVLPPQCELVSGHNRALVALRAGQRARFTYDVRAPRGRHDFARTAIRARDRWSVRAWEWSDEQPTVVRVYPRVLPLRTLPRPLRTRASVGDYVSPALGDGIEPGDIRRFAPGDRIRQVNWRASLRLGTLYVTQHHRERNADVILMLDTLADAGAAPDSTLDLGVRAAASLATAYLARKDRVGLINVGGTIDWVRPASGRVHYERLAETLLRASVVFTYVTKDLARVPSRVLPSHALVIAITSLLDLRFTHTALDLAARGFDLAVVVVSPVEVTRNALPRTQVNDLACRLWALERRARLDEFRRHGIAVLEWDTTAPLEQALAGYGRRRPQRVAAQ
jgi:uncharacterized protein (DUF58 family)